MVEEVRRRGSEIALPHLRDVESKSSLLAAISHLVNNYSVGELEKAKGSSTIPLAEGGGSMAPYRSFRNEKWYRDLEPKEKTRVELELAEHIHREVVGRFPCVLCQLRQGGGFSDKREFASLGYKRFGHRQATLNPTRWTAYSTRRCIPVSHPLSD
jgi:hypothetical protein